MKKSIPILFLSAFIVGGIITSCNTPSQKAANDENKVIQANNDLDKANQDYLTDIQNCKKETTEHISTNETLISELKAKAKTVKKDTKEDYNKSVADLEQKNREMKNKMNDYKADGKEKWQAFKKDFDKGMDEIGNSIKDLFASNKVQEQVQ